jgi:hypothetical protein
VAANNDDSKKTSYTQALEGYKGQSLPSTGIPVKIREVFLDSMLHYGFDTDAASMYKVAAFLTHLETKGFLVLLLNISCFITTLVFLSINKALMVT